MSATPEQAMMAPDNVTPFGAKNMGDQELTEDGKAIAVAIENLLLAARKYHKLGACEKERRYEIAEANCLKRFRQLWKALKKHGDCYLGDAADEEIKRRMEIYP